VSNKAIYKPKGKANEYSEWACNFYKGCSGMCSYCFNKKGITAKVLGGDIPILKSCFKDERDVKEIFIKELKINKTELQKYGLFFSFTSDFFDDTKELLIWAIETCLFNNIPVKVLTKQTYWINTNLLSYLKGCEKEIAFGFTLTGHDELEEGCATNLERIYKMKLLHDLGFITWTSIEPIVDFESSKRMIELTVNFCDLYKIGLMSGKKYDILESQNFVEWLNELEQSKIYLKESLQKLSKYTNEELDNYFVTKDYNIFNGRT
jgi:DNA repair photolyase